MRIFDRVASGEAVVSRAGAATAGTTSFWRKANNESQRIVADEAAQLFFQSDLNSWNMGDGAGKFGRQIPPQPHTWVEWIEPSAQIVGGQVALTQSFRYAGYIREEVRSDGSRILVGAFLWSHKERHQSPVTLFPYTLGLAVDSDGGIVDVSPNSWPQEVRAIFGDVDQEVIGPYMMRQIMPAFLALGLMHCKKVNLIAGDVSSKAIRSRNRRSRFEAMDYRRLVIGGKVGDSLARNREAGTSGLIAEHMVRAHIRTVRTPLGGHNYGYTGDLLIRGHVRGNPKRGRINKEYHVTGEGSE